MIANGIMRPSLILLEDYQDLPDFLEATQRTIPRSKWAEESIAAAQRRQNASMF